MDNRFEISTEGMRLLHEGRPLWQLIKELVANAWDEEANCRVAIKTNFIPGYLCVDVEDDGGGFRDIADTYTLMAPTTKRGKAETRGRFNIGEKELLSVAYSAYVETVGFTVYFPHEGGKKIVPNNRRKGTLISVMLDTHMDEGEETIKILRTFIPPLGLQYRVNGELIEYDPPIAITQATLPTVLSSGPNQPIRNTIRKTTITIHKLDNLIGRKSGKGRIYEMGIPIQDIDVPFDVDIGQKVPLPPNRDVVSNTYLQDVYAEVLAATLDQLTEENASETWVRLAVEDPRTTGETVKAVMDKKLGTNAMLSLPFDKEANEEAFGAGQTLINPKTLSTIEREKFKAVGLSSTQMYSRPKNTPELTGKDLTPEMLQVKEYTEWMSSQLLGFECNVVFVNQKQASHLACYGGREFTWNIGTLGKKFFKNAPTKEQDAIILHELAHDRGSDVRAHGTQFVHTLGDLSARALVLAKHLGEEGWWKPN